MADQTRISAKLPSYVHFSLFGETSWYSPQKGNAWIQMLQTQNCHISMQPRYYFWASAATCKH